MTGEPGPAPEPRTEPKPLRRRRGEKREEGDKQRKRKGGIVAFLLASAVPLGALGWYTFMSDEQRASLAEKIPAGVGGRAIQAGIAFGILVLLARVALPAFHGASGSLGGVIARIDQARMGVRILLFPVRALVWLLWFCLQLLFAVDAFLIIVAGVVGLLLTIRILKPDFLPGVLEGLSDIGGETGGE